MRTKTLDVVPRTVSSDGLLCLLLWIAKSADGIKAGSSLSMKVTFLEHFFLVVLFLVPVLLFDDMFVSCWSVQISSVILNKQSISSTLKRFLQMADGNRNIKIINSDRQFCSKITKTIQVLKQKYKLKFSFSFWWTIYCMRYSWMQKDLVYLTKCSCILF